MVFSLVSWVVYGAAAAVGTFLLISLDQIAKDIIEVIDKQTGKDGECCKVNPQQQYLDDRNGVGTVPEDDDSAEVVFVKEPLVKPQPKVKQTVKPVVRHTPPVVKKEEVLNENDIPKFDYVPVEQLFNYDSPKPAEQNPPEQKIQPPPAKMQKRVQQQRLPVQKPDPVKEAQPVKQLVEIE